MKKVTCFLIVFSIFFFAEAQNEVIKIWPKLAPGTENVKNIELWIEKKEVSNVYQPDLTIFLPKKKKKRATPAVFVFPGGGYRKVVIEKEGYKVAQWLNDNGIAAFVLKYRLNQKDALRDARRAVQLIRKNAEDYNIDPNKIGAIGFSAGANLAGNLVENNQQFEPYDELDSISAMPNFWIGIYGVYGDFEFSEGQRKLNDYEAHEGIPPTFIVHAGDDPGVHVKQSVDLYSSLIEKGVAAELHIYEHGKHGFALETNRGEAITSTVNSWSNRCIEWLRISGIL